MPKVKTGLTGALSIFGVIVPPRFAPAINGTDANANPVEATL